MSEADRVYLRNILDQERAKLYSELSESEHFEVFASEQVLKRFALDSEEIQSGITGGPMDGGVDSAYLFVDRKLIRDDIEDYKSFRKRAVSIELVIIQSKRETGYAEEAVNKLRATTDDLLDLSKEIDGLTSTYDSKLIEIARRFREAFKALMTYVPTLSIHYHYVTLADRVDPKVQRKADQLKERVKELYSIATPGFSFVGVKELLELYNRAPSKTLTLKASKTLSSSKYGTAYVCLVPLHEFFDFITDDGEVRQDIFESNVRDYQGDVRVNKEIQETLAERAEQEFWWLNNGITVISSRVNAAADILTVEDPEVVNGLQTSREVYNYFRNHANGSDQRNILVRIIEIRDSKIRDNIIRATNSQSEIPAESLHATEEVHRRIETFFNSYGLNYERRKGYYRNRGIPSSKTVSIKYLAQAVTAILLQRPNEARARIGSYLENNYNKVFNDDYPPELYVKCAMLMKRVDAAIKATSPSLDRGRQSDIRFYVAMFAACIASKSCVPNQKAISDIDVSSITAATLNECIESVLSDYEALGATDKVAKGPDLLERVVAAIGRRVAPPSSKATPRAAK